MNCDKENSKKFVLTYKIQPYKEEKVLYPNDYPMKILKVN